MCVELPQHTHSPREIEKYAYNTHTHTRADAHVCCLPFSLQNFRHFFPLTTQASVREGEWVGGSVLGVVEIAASAAQQNASILQNIFNQVQYASCTGCRSATFYFRHRAALIKKQLKKQQPRFSCFCTYTHTRSVERERGEERTEGGPVFFPPLHTYIHAEPSITQPSAAM